MSEQVSPTTKGLMSDENQNKDTPTKRTPSKRRSHIERIQEESKELLKNMGIEELSDARSTRRSTRSSTKTQPPTPVTPPSAKKTPTTPSSSRRGRKKKVDEDDQIQDSQRESVENNVTSTNETAFHPDAEEAPPSKRPKLSETIASEENKIVSKESNLFEESKPDDELDSVSQSSDVVSKEIKEQNVHSEMASSSKSEQNVSEVERMDVDENKSESTKENELIEQKGQSEKSIENLKELSAESSTVISESVAIDVDDDDDDGVHEVVESQKEAQKALEKRQEVEKTLAISEILPQTTENIESEPNEAEVAKKEEQTEIQGCHEDQTVEAMEVDSSSVVQLSNKEEVKASESERQQEEVPLPQESLKEDNEVSDLNEVSELSHEFTKDEETNVVASSSNSNEGNENKEAIVAESDNAESAVEVREDSKQEHISEYLANEANSSEKPVEEQVNQIESTTNESITEEKAVENIVETSPEIQESSTDIVAAVENNQVTENASCEKVEAVETISSSDEAKIETSQDEPNIANDDVIAE